MIDPSHQCPSQSTEPCGWLRCSTCQSIRNERARSTPSSVKPCLIAALRCCNTLSTPATVPAKRQAKLIGTIFDRFYPARVMSASWRSPTANSAKWRSFLEKNGYKLSELLTNCYFFSFPLSPQPQSATRFGCQPNVSERRLPTNHSTVGSEQDLTLNVSERRLPTNHSSGAMSCLALRMYPSGDSRPTTAPYPI